MYFFFLFLALKVKIQDMDLPKKLSEEDIEFMFRHADLDNVFFLFYLIG